MKILAAIAMALVLTSSLAHAADRARMKKAIQELKVQAKKRHRSLLAGDQNVFRRLHRRFPKTDEFKLKHSLHLVAYEKGFTDWPMALRYLSGVEHRSAECGGFWYSQRCSSLLNHWFVSYDEAKQFLNSTTEIMNWADGRL